jgi:hypothetical protein
MTVPENQVAEVQVRRCDVCNRAFVLRYRLPGEVPDLGGRVHVKTEWVRCASASCHHVQPVLVPAPAFDVDTIEWLG